MSQINKLKNWFNQQENLANIAHYYPKRKWLSKISWRILCGLLITLALYLILLGIIHNPQPNETITYSPLESFGFVLILLAILFFMCFSIYIDRICFKNTKSLIVSNYDEAIDTIAELRNKNNNGFTFQGFKILPDLELATIEKNKKNKKKEG